MFKKILPVLLLTFVNTLGFSILIPVLPFIVRNSGNQDLVYGLLISCYSGFQFLGAAALGQLSDHYGRKPLLIISQAGTLFSWFIFALAWFIEVKWSMVGLSIIVIAIARIADGITGGNNAIANAYLSDVLPPQQKGIAFGYMGVMLGVGLMVGPAIGSAVSSFSIGYLGMVIFSIVLSTITLLSMILFLKESLHVDHRAEKPFQSFGGIIQNFLKRLYIFKSIKPFSSNQLVMSVLLIKFFVSMILAAYSTVIVLLLIDKFQFTQKQVGYFLLLVGFFFIFNQSFLVKLFIKRLGELKTLLAGLILISLGLFIFPVLDQIIPFIAFYYFTNLGLSLSLPTIRAILARETSPKQQGQILGIDESLMAISMTFAPLASSFIYTHIGWPTFMILGLLGISGSVYFYIKNKNLLVTTQA